MVQAFPPHLPGNLAKVNSRLRDGLLALPGSTEKSRGKHTATFEFNVGQADKLESRQSLPFNAFLLPTHCLRGKSSQDVSHRHVVVVHVHGAALYQRRLFGPRGSAHPAYEAAASLLLKAV